MRVFVTGGTGYVGQIVVRRLLDDGHQVVVLTRPESARRVGDGRAIPVLGHVFELDKLRQAMAGCDALVHLIGIIRERPRQGMTMRRLHVDATQTVLQAAEQSGIRQVVHMSALGSRPDAVSTYHRTKWLAETLVRDSGRRYTILRPSVVFGKGGPGPNFLAQLADLIRSAPLVPVIGHGQFPLQPVSIETVAEAIARTLVSPVAENHVYELGGIEVLTYVEILRRIAAAMGKPPLRTVRVPMSLMTAVVPFMERFPQFPLTSDQLTMLQEGNVCADAETAYTDLGLKPLPFRVP